MGVFEYFDVYIENIDYDLNVKHEEAMKIKTFDPFRGLINN
jgi:hypothetical protein